MPKEKTRAIFYITLKAVLQLGNKDIDEAPFKWESKEYLQGIHHGSAVAKQKKKVGEETMDFC